MYLYVHIGGILEEKSLNHIKYEYLVVFLRNYHYFFVVKAIIYT